MDNFRNLNTNKTTTGKWEDALERTAYWGVPEKQSQKAIWEKIDARTTIPSTKGRILSFSKTYASLSAAAAALVLGLFIAWIAARNTITTASGEHLQVNLPDGSEVTLNAESELRYNRLVYAFARNVSLKGEAWFEVEKGQPFQVNTPGGKVKVLGTTFNVYARSKEFRTHCITGSVAVLTGAQQQKLQAGEAAKQTAGSLDLYSFNAQEARPDWKQGRLHYQNEALETVIQELERQFAVEVTLQTTKNRHYTGSFTLHDLDSALKTICKPMGLSYSKRNQQINIYKQNH